MNEHHLIKRDEAQIAMCGVTDLSAHQIIPEHRSDPEQCLFDNWWYSSPASLSETATLQRGNNAGEPNEQGECEVTMLHYPEDSIGPAIEEDVAVFVTQQRGFRSRGFKGVYLSNQEKRIRRYHELIDDYIDGVLPKA